ncbi:MAG: hypothetical protein LBO20_02965, partial [Bifidobacteriaceae bacterium]|nr:hypothetical protein [Bifidobacteriaceae bacterium]
MAALMGGCFKLDAQFEVTTEDKKDTVSGTVVFALADKAFNLVEEATEIGQSDLLESLEDEVKASAEDAFGTSGQVTEYDAEGHQGFQVALAGVPLSKFGAGQDGDLAITHADDQFKLSGYLDVGSFARATIDSIGADEFADVEAQAALSKLLDKASATVSFTFPGKVLSTSGTADGKTATFQLSLEGPTKIEAIAKDSPFPWMAIIIVVAVVALAAAAVVLIRVRRRRPRQPSEAPQAAQVGLGGPEPGSPPPATPHSAGPPTPQAEDVPVPVTRQSPTDAPPPLSPPPPPSASPRGPAFPAPHAAGAPPPPTPPTPPPPPPPTP